MRYYEIVDNGEEIFAEKYEDKEKFLGMVIEEKRNICPLVFKNCFTMLIDGSIMVNVKVHFKHNGAEYLLVLESVKDVMELSKLFEGH
jgi:hypothetical protein